jgi:hypothetical protein
MAYRVGWMWTIHHDALVAGILALKEYLNAERAIVRHSRAM